MIKGNENIKGINIQGSHTKNIQYLISQFADDTTLMDQILDGTVLSFHYSKFHITKIF